MASNTGLSTADPAEPAAHGALPHDSQRVSLRPAAPTYAPCANTFAVEPLADFARTSHRPRRGRHVPHLSRRKHRAGAPLLSLQVQWQHQIRTPGMPHGVAVTLAEEVLRAVQDVLSLHQALPPRHAHPHTHGRFRAPRRRSHTQAVHDLVSRRSGMLGLAHPLALVYAHRLA